MKSTHVNSETEMCHELSVNYHPYPQRSQANQILGGVDAWGKKIIDLPVEGIPMAPRQENTFHFPPLPPSVSDP